MTETVTPTDIRTVSRRLRDLAEPIAACVYFVPEALQRYEALGLDYAAGYFCSRGACLGRPSGEVVAAAFGVFNPRIVIDAVNRGWEKTDADTILKARLDGATEALERMIGRPDTSRAVGILRPVMEECDYAGRMLFSGLRSLPFPEDPIAKLWRVCDLVREHRGDAHIAAWTSAGLDPIEVTLLTELFWKMPMGTYIQTRGWPADELEAAQARLAERDLVADGAFTDDGRQLRREIEAVTDRMEAGVVRSLGDDADELFALLEPWTNAVLDAGGYPAAIRAARDGD